MNKEDLLLVFGLLLMVGLITFSVRKISSRRSPASTLLLLEEFPRDRKLVQEQILQPELSIQTLDLSRIPSSRPRFQQGDTVYIVLKSLKNHAVPVQIHATRPNVDLFARGTVDHQEKKKLTVSFQLSPVRFSGSTSEQINRRWNDTTKNDLQLRLKVRLSPEGLITPESLQVDGTEFPAQEKPGAESDKTEQTPD